jgi:hypothetical protein
MIRNIDWQEVYNFFEYAEPFRHVVIDNFFLPEIADKLSSEFPNPESSDVIKYINPLEIKMTCNRWDSFPSCTYRAFTMFGRDDFLNNIKYVSNEKDLWFDFGLNGGGWHMHGRGGNNNIHLDYNLHPKLGEQRKLNIIVYLTKDWCPAWGGGLELWSGNKQEPYSKEKTIENVFNRAILFDTTQNSWHGLPDNINCPEGIYRKSIAAYFLRPAPNKTEQRGRALFFPRENQKDDPEVLEIIKKRANILKSSEVYRK